MDQETSVRAHTEDGSENEMIEESHGSSSDASERLRYVAAKLRDTRRKKGYSLRQVTELLQNSPIEPVRLSPSQISRIETAKFDVGVQTLEALCRVLEISYQSVIMPEKKPWFKVRNEVSLQRLEDLAKGVIKVQSDDDDRHKYMIDKGIYQHVALDKSAVVNDEGEEEFEPTMRGYKLRIRRAAESDMRKGGYSHLGEEIIYVIAGEIECWLKQPTRETVRKITIRTGDSLQFSSQLTHSFRATGPEDDALALFVNTEPPDPSAPKKYKNVPASNETEGMEVDHDPE